MYEMTKEKAAAILASPNGSEKLFEQAEAAFAPAWALFNEDSSPAALAFLVRCAKRLEYRKQLELLLGPGRERLLAALGADEPKLRRNAARLVGALAHGEDTAALIKALEGEETRFVRPSLILAIGACAGEGSGEYLDRYRVAPAANESEARHAADETEALAAARKRFISLEKHTFTGLAAPRRAVLTAPEMLAGSLAEELRALGTEPIDVGRDSVTVETADVAALYKCRCFFELFFPIAEKASPIARLTGPAVRERVRALMLETHSGKPPFGYRIEVRGEEADRAAVAKAFAENIDCAELVNSPGNYEAEIRLEMKKSGVTAMVKLMNVPDGRFDYRLGKLPASIHPATAAAALRYAMAHFKAGARVIDPCCGSGTMLIEREKLLDAASLTGVDIAHAAIDIARKNAAAAGSKAKFVTNDLRRFTPERPYDELISNLPFGNRVGSHRENEAVYAALLDSLPRWLVPGGVAVLYTMEFTLLKKLVRERPGLTLVTETRTEAGGLMPGIFIIKTEKRSGLRR